jgi:Ran GTPase-activating protein (RanGAP) involved in mRNA processing and transport
MKHMKALTQLDVSENDIGDQGITEIVRALKDFCQLEKLDLSGNSIGKTSLSAEFAVVVHDYLYSNQYLDTLKMNWNNLRGAVGEKIIDGLVNCYKIKAVHLNNNLLGVAYEGKEPPVCKMADLLQHSKTLEHIDLSNNFIE